MSTNGHTLNKNPEEEENDHIIVKSVAVNSDSRKGTYSNGIGVQHTSVSNTVEKATKLLEVLMKMQETITLHGNSSDVTHSINASDVNIIPSPDTQTTGSSMVRISNVVDYGWEQKYYTGNVVAVHKSGIYIAYSLKASNKQDSLVRILNKKTLQRALIKGVSGEVKDLAFSFLSSQIILAIVDESGLLHVYQVMEHGSTSIEATLLLKITRPRDMCVYRRVAWCHYHPDDPLLDISQDEEKYFRTLVITHDNKAEVIHLDTIIKVYSMRTDVEIIKEDMQRITCHDKPITEALFAPDGSAIATASLNGEVRFYQVVVFDEERQLTPKCLHKWEPHGGKPVNSLFFLDNHKSPNPCQAYWKFAVTGADDNCEIKVWCCVDWGCLQTIRFDVPSMDNVKPCLKACIDPSGEYLLLSDINRKVLYVLQFYQEPELNKACVVSLSEFPLIFPMLSFSIMQAGVKKVRKSSDPAENVDGENQSDEEETIHDVSDDATHTEETVFKLLYVQPKSLQECRVGFPTLYFAPKKANSADPLCAMSQESISSFKDGLSDLSIDRTNESTCAEDELSSAGAATTPTATASTSLSSNSQLLLTPEAFTSPSLSQGTSNYNHLVANNILKSSPNTSAEPVVTPSFKPALPAKKTVVRGVELGNLVDIDEQHPLATSERIAGHEINGTAPSLIRRSHHSSSSSPSREVAEILSENGDTIYKSPVLNSEPEVDNSSGTPKTTSWPAAPDIQKISQQNSPRDSNNKPSYQTIDFSEQFLKYRKITDDLITDLKKREKTLDNTVQAMSTVLQNQQEELINQKQIIMALKDEIQSSHVKIEKAVASAFDMAQHQQESKIKKTIEGALQSKVQQDRKNNDQLTASLSQVMVNTVNSKVEKVVRNELKSVVMPALPKLLDSVAESIQSELAQKISSFENKFKEQLCSLVESKQISDVIRSSVNTSVHAQVSETYRESFEGFILPSFEKSCQTMFEQLNETFFKGTNEYLVQLEEIADKDMADEERDSGANQIQLKSIGDNVQSLTSSIDAQKKKLEDIEQALSKQQESLCNSVVTAMRSGSETPVRTIVDSQMHQQQVQVLIRQGKVNAAFQQALSVADLSAVIYVCEQYDPGVIFNQEPCQLEEPVILSLIQQFSTELRGNTELKYKYLEEALVSLDLDHPTTKSHYPTICKGLHQNLEIFLKSSPEPNLAKQTKLLLMITKPYC